MSAGIFRQSALDRLASPERLDEIVRITTPGGWLALLGGVAIVLAALAWALFGSVTTTVPGSAVVIPSGGISQVPAVAAGAVRAVRVAPGQTVRAGQVVAVTAGPTGTVPLRAPVAGTVLAVSVGVGGYVQAGTAVAVIEASGRSPEVEAYVPAAAAASVHPGMTVQFAPVGFPSQVFGVLLGRVRYVSSFPASYASVVSLVGSQSLARLLTRSGPVVAVAVTLVRTRGGVDWSLGRYAAVVPAAGTTGEASIVLRRQRPVAYLLGP